MELLLFLSAILTAFTGVVTSGRVPETQAQHCVPSCEAPIVAAVATVRPDGHAHPLREIGRWRGFAAIRPAATVTAASLRLYLDRPRT